MSDKVTWQFGFNDSDPMDWIITVFYAVAFAFCLFAFLRAHKADDKEYAISLGWLFLSFLVFFLGANKQLDLQTLIIQAAKQVALRDHWYEYRRKVQIAFTMVLLIGTGVTAYLIQSRARSFFEKHPGATIGAALLVGYALIRAASIDHVEKRLGLDWAFIRTNGLMELSGTVLVFISALRARWQKKPA